MPKQEVITTGVLRMSLVWVAAWACGCSAPPQLVNDSSDDASDVGSVALDPETAPKVTIDRFSSRAGTLYVRDASNELPGPNEPIDFDVQPFITRGLGPDGESILYYNLDVQPSTAADVYVLIREGATEPIPDQLFIFDVIPGDDGYSDFWHVHLVTVSADYVANTITSIDAIANDDLEIQATTIIVNCPMVPDGSVAQLRLNGGSEEIQRGWYRDQIVTFFTFEEQELTAAISDRDEANVPIADIFVSFNVNPDEPEGGPASGIKLEAGSDQSHNIAAAIPPDPAYSPLWLVNVFDNDDFDDVQDLSSAFFANLLPFDELLVNCPIVEITE